ncbi:oxysterol-binding protein-related protein 11-like [Micropterus dolomieu]|uniref:oxysterol-binding protein-related protein 11-like n=1 Tax=Micropterus dolomieu TaxID=147949 RepID=UPI001E8E333D|nr:oxysterol-binding protein-related protein 11-like [Micropterus dolomieu]
MNIFHKKTISLNLLLKITYIISIKRCLCIHYIVLPKCRVTAEVKHNPTNAVVCRVQGEWNGVLEFSYTSGETRVVDVTKLPVTKKCVRPIEKQGPTESRRLWQHVTESLREKDIEKATEHKRLLEERQRTEERHRAETETAWRTRYFDREGEGWVYHKPLWKNSAFKS